MVVPLIERAGEWGVTHIPNLVRIVAIPPAAWLLVRLFSRLVKRVEHFADDGDPATLSEREKRAQTLGRIVRQVIRVGTYTLAGVLLLGELGLDIKPLLAGAGIVGLAVGFGAQALVKDLISGFFFLLEDQVRIGDVIGAAGVSGVVEAMNLRTIILRDAEGRVHVIPNGAVTVVTNHTREWSVALLDLTVGYREDVDRVLGVLREVGGAFEADPAWAGRLVAKFEYPGVERLGDSSVVVRMSVRTRPNEQWAVQRELRRRIKLAFDAHGIEMPLPAFPPPPAKA